LTGTDTIPAMLKKICPGRALRRAAAIGLLVLQAAAWAQAFTLDLLSPADARPITTREFVNVLGRTAPGSTVRVGGEAVTVYPTGVFVRDRVPLVLGANSIRIEATSATGQTLERLLDIERNTPPPAADWPTDRLWLDGSSLRPAETLRVAPGEPVEVALRATPGQQVQARLPGQDWQALVEATPGSYRALLRFEGAGDVEPAPVELRVEGAALPRSVRPRSVLTQSFGNVGAWRADPQRLVVAGPDGADLLHGLHEVRLGGPNLAELPAGTMLQLIGQRGDRLRVQLSPDTSAWVAERAVQPAPAGSLRPYAVFSNVSVAGGASATEGDTVTLALPPGQPYAVRAVALPGVGQGGGQTLQVDIWGAHEATTWITHRASARLVREVRVEQTGPERVRVHIELHAGRLWGWRSERVGGSLRITVRPPPALPATGSPLAGMRIALEAGHGSADNLGAVGATGVPEKDINRWTAQALQAELEAAGATVVQVREGDDNPPLRERARRVTASDAQLFVSVHANSADTTAGYLRAAGTSTYYKHATGRDLATAVQNRVLELTGLPDFGVIGAFNYAPVRLVTWMPAMLFEQAFVSHPGEEAKVLDPAFRALMARAVRLGLEDYLRARLP
jgi:N-acetylmuramoyl-L-alanine amidase